MIIEYSGKYVKIYSNMKITFYSVVLMEPNLDDPGFVSPLDPGPSSRATLPPSESSSSEEEE